MSKSCTVGQMLCTANTSGLSSFVAVFTLDNALFSDSWSLGGKYLTYILVSVIAMDAFAKTIWTWEIFMLV